MLILPEGDADEVKRALGRVTKVHEAGYVEKGKGAKILEDGRERDFRPLFREAPYTRVKKVVGEKAPEGAELMREGINRATEGALEKKRDILKYIKGDRVERWKRKGPRS
jgi:hydrogenase expression/formation protein